MRYLTLLATWLRYGWPVARAFLRVASDGKVTCDELCAELAALWPKDTAGNHVPVSLPFMK